MTARPESNETRWRIRSSVWCSWRADDAPRGAILVDGRLNEHPRGRGASVRLTAVPSPFGSACRSPGTVWLLCTTVSRSYIRPRAEPASPIWVIAAANGACTTTNSGARRLSAASLFSEHRCVGEMPIGTRKR
jgi:hypothetical protein